MTRCLWWAEFEAAVWPVTVVVGDVGSQDGFEMASPKPTQAFAGLALAPIALRHAIQNRWSPARSGLCTPQAGTADGIRRGARRRDSAEDGDDVEPLVRGAAEF
jgi:hypothetical protein